MRGGRKLVTILKRLVKRRLVILRWNYQVTETPVAMMKIVIGVS